jgi:hypothetical protein
MSNDSVAIEQMFNLMIEKGVDPVKVDTAGLTPLNALSKFNSKRSSYK